jgi:hypothetical protein
MDASQEIPVERQEGEACPVSARSAGSKLVVLLCTTPRKIETILVSFDILVLHILPIGALLS